MPLTMRAALTTSVLAMVACGSSGASHGDAGNRVDGTAAQCPVPSNVQVAYATGTVCDGTGKASAASANGCCSDVIPAVDDVSIAFSGANYQGPLTPCDELDPLAGADFKVQVQKSEVGPYSGTLTQTVVDAARTDPARSCRVRKVRVSRDKS